MSGRQSTQRAAGRVPMAIGVGLAMFATSPTWAQEPGGADPGEGGELADGQGTRFAVELAEEEGSGGCDCSTTSSPAGPFALLALAALARRRRRR